MSDQSKETNLNRGAAWSLMDNSFRQILALGVFLITARFVSVEAFGIMAVSLLIVEFFKQAFVESVGTAITSISKPDDADYNACFIVIIIGSIASAIIIFLLSNIIAHILDNEDFAAALKWVCLLLASTGLTRTHEAWLSRNLKFKALALRSIISVVIGGIVGIYLAYSGYGLMALIMQQLTVTFVASFMLWITTSWKPKIRTSKTKIIRLVNFSKHVIITNTSNMLKTQSDVFLSSYYLGEYATGVYNGAKRILTALNLTLASSLGRVAHPFLSNIQDDTYVAGRAFLKATMFTAMFTAPIYAGISFLADDLINVLLGEKWLASAPILSILALSGFLATIDQYHTITMLIKNKPNWLGKLTMFYAILNLVLILIFARYGLIALAAAFTARSIICFPISTYYALKLLNVAFKEYIKAIITPLLSTLFMVLSLHLLNVFISVEYPLLNILINSFLGSLIYFTFLYLADPKKIKELVVEIKKLL